MKEGLLTPLLADPIKTIPDASHQGLQFGLFHLQQETKIDTWLQKSSDDFNQPILSQNLLGFSSSHF